MGQNLKNSYLPHRGELRPHIWGGEPLPTYLQNDPKMERFRDFGTPILGTPTTITSVKNFVLVLFENRGFWGDAIIRSPERP